VREETVMPTYSYRCQDCGATFERVETITEHRTDKPRCPKCDGEKVVQVPTPFVAMTGKKS
jgi:putative FmdB family regulatory protein